MESKRSRAWCFTWNNPTDADKEYIMYPELSMDAINANFGGNPSEEAYFLVFATSTNNASDPVSCSVVVTIDYTVKMWELKEFVQS